VERLRERVADASLEELFLDTYAVSLKHIVKRRRPMHPETLRVWNAIVAGDVR
jgi:HD superfamily phosphohydrolase YqeK